MRSGTFLASALALASAGLAGCASPAPPPASILDEVSQGEWSVSRARLAAARERQPKRPYVERVRVAMTEPRTGKRYQARGAVAVDPDRAARLLLLGPGGTTAIDVWVTREKFRVAVPAIGFERRGGRDATEARGLPVAMLRWWFLAPLSGRLLLARSSEAQSSWLLKDGLATVMVRTDGARFLAVRSEEGRREGIEWSAGPDGAASGRGLYVDGSGLRVEVLVEEVLPDEPDPAAFAEPEGAAAPGGTTP